MAVKSLLHPFFSYLSPSFGKVKLGNEWPWNKEKDGEITTPINRKYRVMPQIGVATFRFPGGMGWFGPTPQNWRGSGQVFFFKDTSSIREITFLIMPVLWFSVCSHHFNESPLLGRQDHWNAGTPCRRPKRGAWEAWPGELWYVWGFDTDVWTVWMYASVVWFSWPCAIGCLDGIHSIECFSRVCRGRCVLF